MNGISQIEQSSTPTAAEGVSLKRLKSLSWRPYHKPPSFKVDVSSIETILNDNGNFFIPCSDTACNRYRRDLGGQKPPQEQENGTRWNKTSTWT